MLVGVGDLINYAIFCIFVDLVGVGDLKIPAVYEGEVPLQILKL